MTDLDHAETDRLVQERVMGECAHRHQCRQPGIVVWYRCPDCRREDTIRPVRPPEYSRDIQAAWAVVERLRSQGWRMTLEMDEGGEWSCLLTHLWPNEIGCLQVAASGKSAPLAICAAALAAVGEGEK